MVDLSPHQTKAVESLDNGKVLHGGVGVGKSRVAIAYYMKNEKHRDIYIITVAKKRDSLEWQGEASKFGLGRERDATVAGVLTVDSWNNIGKYTDVTGGFFIFDEQRLVGSGAWVKAFYKIAKRNRWILLSATPGDTWIDYIPIFVANGFYKNKTEFVRRHVVYNNYVRYPKVERYVETARLNKLRRLVLVDMPYEKQTVRHLLTIPVKYNEEHYDIAHKKRWNRVLNRPIRDAGELYRILRRVTNEHSSRIDAVRKLMEKHDRLVIFYNFNYELDALREHFPGDSTYEVAEWNGHKHEQIPDSDRWLYLVQYTSGAEGWNCTDTDAMVFYSLTSSYRVFEQAQGRIDRMNSPYRDLYYYVFRSRSQIDKSIWKSLLYKQNFNESAFIRSLKFDEHQKE